MAASGQLSFGLSMLRSTYLLHQKSLTFNEEPEKAPLSQLGVPNQEIEGYIRPSGIDEEPHRFPNRLIEIGSK